MKLTGKLQEYFYVWLKEEYSEEFKIEKLERSPNFIISEEFHYFPLSFQNTLIQEFLDTYGVYISVTKDKDWWVTVDYPDGTRDVNIAHQLQKREAVTSAVILMVDFIVNKMYLSYFKDMAVIKHYNENHESL